MLAPVVGAYLESPILSPVPGGVPHNLATAVSKETVRGAETGVGRALVRYSNLVANPNVMLGTMINMNPALVPGQFAYDLVTTGPKQMVKDKVAEAKAIPHYIE